MEALRVEDWTKMIAEDTTPHFWELYSCEGGSILATAYWPSNKPGWRPDLLNMQAFYLHKLSLNLEVSTNWMMTSDSCFPAGPFPFFYCIYCHTKVCEVRILAAAVYFIFLSGQGKVLSSPSATHSASPAHKLQKQNKFHFSKVENLLNNRYGFSLGSIHETLLSFLFPQSLLTVLEWSNGARSSCYAAWLASAQHCSVNLSNY